MVGRRILSVPSKSSSNEVGQTKETLTRRAKFLQRILDHFWNRGRIVRSAVVRVKSGNSPAAEWRRRLQRLYPLEVKLDTETANVPVRVVRDEDVPVVVVNSD